MDWHSTKFRSPIGDRAAMPILHLNGYQVSNPTVLEDMREQKPRGQHTNGLVATAQHRDRLASPWLQLKRPNCLTRPLW